jgi:hypothetical protein
MPFAFDATLKDLLAPAPAEFVSAFGLPTIRPIVSLNVDLSTISAATDVAIGFGDPLQELVDINFQSGPDTDIASRCHLYNAALHFRFKVPVRTLLILLRPKADSGNIQGSLTYQAGQSGVEFRYEVVRMWQQPIERFLMGGIHLLPLATLCKLPGEHPLDEALRDVVREIDARLLQTNDRAQAVRLMTAAFILTGLRVRREMLRPIFDGVRIMHETVAWDYYLEEGCIQGEQRLLLRQGRKRFGEPGEEDITALKAIKDIERLERLGDAVFTANSWQELLATQ